MPSDQTSVSALANSMDASKIVAVSTSWEKDKQGFCAMQPGVKIGN
jgi:hypothetical protein